MAKNTQRTMPVLPLRDVVVFPYMVMPLFVGRAKSINALEEAMNDDKQLLLVSQREADLEEPTPEDLFDVGTIANIIQLLKLPDGTVKVLVEGQNRAKINNLEDGEKYFSAQITPIETTYGDEKELVVAKSAVLSEFENYLTLNKKVPTDILNALQRIDDVDRLADTMAAHLPVSIRHKQNALELANVQERLEYLLGMMESEADILQVEKRIRGRVKKQMEKSQRNYYLNEQIKAIRKEMDGGENEDTIDEVEQLHQKVEAAGMPADVRDKVENELQKLKMMSAMSSEATVIRSYIEWMIQVPWHQRSKVKKDIVKAQQVLDTDHYGLDRVKERILEYLAVQARLNKVKGPILCLVGPPGVGKTSLGESIAKATGREFVRMALGGVRDEAEIRGHRRTYIGAMPGKIVQSLTKVGVKNPLFLLDEIDKMAQDYRGDPASAMLEVLDPSQNNKFNDHYLDLDLDLSEVMFICTANSMNIPEALLDRMEVIRLPGYTEEEKVNIADRYLVPKAIKNNGLRAKELTVHEEAIRDIVRRYTREAGVRNLEREVSKIARKVVKEAVSKKAKNLQVEVNAGNLPDYLGPHKFDYGMAEEEAQIGRVNGLAWTSVGGELLTIEVAAVPGKGKFITTGSLGDVMKESITAAMTVVRTRAAELGIEASRFEETDVHVHLPEGATPKDGPSAGLALTTALVSAFTGIAIRPDIAMTGETSLSGRAMRIGGLKEKLLAAHRGGIKLVFIPQENVRDLAEIPENVKEGLEIKAVKSIDEILPLALIDMPKALVKPPIVKASEEAKAARH